jgi:hypothetical protein
MRRSQTRSVVFSLGTLLCLCCVSRDAHAQANKQSSKQTTRPCAPQAKKQSRKEPTGGPPPVLCGALGEVRVVVDLNSTSASTQVEFCSPGGRSTARATLTAGDLTSRMTNLGLGANVSFSRPGEKTGNSPFVLPSIRPGEAMTVAVQISNLWEAGEAEAPLRVNGVDVGKVIAVKYRLPFGVEVEGQNPANPDITLERNQGHAIVLKNGDPVDYQIEWNFQVAGRSSPESSRTIVVTPNSTAAFTVHPDPTWYSEWAGLLRDYDEAGTLTLSFRPPGVRSPSYWPSKVIPVKVHLRYSSETVRAWVANILLIVVLLLGAMFSYFGSVGLPNRLKRSEYRESLARLGQRISGISHQVDSGLRVAVRVQRKRLSELLDSRRNFSPDLNRVFGEVNDGMASLQKQVRVAEQIDTAHSRLKLLDLEGAAPSLLRDAEDRVWKAAGLINHIAPTDQELEQSQSYVDDASALMDKAEALDATFVQGLLAQSAHLQTDLKIFADTDTEVYKKIQAALPGVFADLGVSAAPTTAEESTRLDRNLAKADLIRQFLQIYHVTGNPQVRQELDKQLERLQDELSLDTYEALRRAQWFIREAQEGVYPGDLVQSGKSARIEIDPNVVQANELIRFRVGFEDPRLNRAEARLEFEGRWDFGHDKYGEIGWEPVHYFPRVGSFPVTFKFQGGGDMEPTAVKRTIDVSKRKESWFKRDRDRAESLRFVVALLPAVFGLLAGARDLLLKTDLVSGLVAVFLLGFGSDTVKNLVSQSQQVPAAPTTAPAGGATTGVSSGTTAKPAAGKSSA